MKRRLTIPIIFVGVLLLIPLAWYTVLGHEFHWSDVKTLAQKTKTINKPFEVRHSSSDKKHLAGFRIGNVLASYIHLHFFSNPDVAYNIVRTLASS